MLRKKLLGLMALGVFSFCGAMNDSVGDLLREAPKEVSLLKNQFIFSLVGADQAWDQFNDKWMMYLDTDAYFLIYKLNVPNRIFGDKDSVEILIKIKPCGDDFVMISSGYTFKFVSCEFEKSIRPYSFLVNNLACTDLKYCSKSCETCCRTIEVGISRCLRNAFCEMLLFFELQDPKNFKHEFNKEIYESFSGEGEFCCVLVILPCLHCFNADKILPSLFECPICNKTFYKADAFFLKVKSPTPFVECIRPLILKKKLYRPAGWASLENIF